MPTRTKPLMYTVHAVDAQEQRVDVNGQHPMHRRLDDAALNHDQAVDALTQQHEPSHAEPRPPPAMH